jgi:hypothetical protein
MALQPGQHDRLSFQVELDHARRVDAILQGMPHSDTVEGWRLRRLIDGILCARDNVNKVGIQRRRQGRA